jgi:hypothetical protein
VDKIHYAAGSAEAGGVVRSPTTLSATVDTLKRVIDYECAGERYSVELKGTTKVLCYGQENPYRQPKVKISDTENIARFTWSVHAVGLIGSSLVEQIQSKQ